VTTRSLRWRLLVGAGVAILGAVVVAWVVMTLLFERHLERRLTVELTRDATRLAAAVTVDPAGRLSLVNPLTDPRLATPAGGFYWQASAPGQTVRSRSLWDEALTPVADAPADAWRLRRAAGPFQERVFLLERAIRPDAGGPDVLIQLAEDSSEVMSARSEFGRELALFLTVLGLFLAAAAWLQVRLGLGPLARIRDDVAALHVSASARLPSARLDELRPLTDAINDLAEARDAELRKARTRASDLAHGLKTPLAALRAQSRRVRDAGQVDVADGFDRAIAAITATTEAELARSRLAAARRGGSSAIRAVAEQVVGVIEQTERGEVIAISLDMPDDVAAPMDRDDLAELLGPLIENAARFARRQVRIGASASPEGARLTIDDDGPGIASDRSREAFARGARLDQTGPGTGLGLAIARDLAEASGGRLVLTRSTLGGLRAEVVWPTPN
jgi:signal transduction histidine kinase